MNQRIKNINAISTVLIAIFLIYFAFKIQLLNFWYSMAIATITLTILSFIFGGNPFKKGRISIQSISMGIISGILLYGLFWLGNLVSSYIFPFALEQINSLYQFRHQSELWMIILILLFITSPAEELYWRGFIQWWLTQLLGETKGLIYGAILYAAVHLVSGNLMLVLSAIVAGLFWGYLYNRTDNMAIPIISHAVWAILIFVVMPLS